MVTLAPPGFASWSRLKLASRRFLVLAYSDPGRLLDSIASDQHSAIDIVRVVVPPNDDSDNHVRQALAPENLRKQGIRGIIVVRGDRPLPEPLLLRCRLEGFRVLDEAAFFEQESYRIDVDAKATGWLLSGQGFRCGRVAMIRSRIFDLLISVVLLILTLPLMLLVALVIKIDSNGPVFYRQQRVGLRGRIFTVYKFRSMQKDAEAGCGPTWALVDDPRITRVGRVIRYCRIDELPQLLNVLRGEMSIIGPRPERPFFVEQLTTAIPLYFVRHYVKPGITGWAQVNAPYGASVDDAREKLRYDLYYVKHRKLWLDIIILWRTLRVVVFGEGAR